MGSFLTVVPEITSVEDKHGTVICSRVQVPLILSYGVTIHRAQGLILDCVNCNVDGLFAKGQLLVGLSRVRDCQLLRVLGTLSRNLVCQSP